MVQSIEAARAVERRFPSWYSIGCSPTTSMRPCSRPCRSADYRPMSGRSKDHDLKELPHARQDRLVPGIIRKFPAGKRASGTSLAAHCIADGQAGLHPATGARIVEPLSGGDFAKVGMYLDPDPHARHSGLSHPAAYRHALEGHYRSALSAEGRCQYGYRYDLSRIAADGTMPKRKMKLPNTGYAFAVGTIRGIRRPGRTGGRPDSILLTYFVGAGRLPLATRQADRQLPGGFDIPTAAKLARQLELCIWRGARLRGPIGAINADLMPARIGREFGHPRAPPQARSTSTWRSTSLPR